MCEFDGKPLQEQVEVGEGEGARFEKKDITLKDALLGYLRRADKMGLKEPELKIAYSLGFILAEAENVLELTTEQYNVLKKLADKGEINLPNGTSQPIYGFVLRYQVKDSL
ncbi:MAG: hypothetical protein BWY69_00253 [Planctomycetes bacterium ADurb.Bin401]|nr:MAG: hypothetical protein BWY69_00253 [Planctomycetes bacterium ADurb.Bin401]